MMLVHGGERIDRAIGLEGNKVRKRGAVAGLKRRLAEGEIFQRPRWDACGNEFCASMLPRALLSRHGLSDWAEPRNRVP